MKVSTTALVVVLLLTLWSCDRQDVSEERLKIFKNYFRAYKNESENQWDYTRDTVRIWFETKSGEPLLKVKRKRFKGKWVAWDREMNAISYYDSLWYDKAENAVTGFFYENNDFYKLIGKNPTKTIRTYWFDKDNRIPEILLYWIPEENTTTSEHLKPIVKWARNYDSLMLDRIYKNGNIIPSGENARKWKELLTIYNNYNN